MAKIIAVNEIRLDDKTIDLSRGFPAFFRAWIVANDIKTLTCGDRQKAEQEYANLCEFSKRGWCGIEANRSAKKIEFDR
ncbi:hypothetical protein [Magnetovibrio blakemorei]|uniref:Uncharacterized protein n=1 Tax=Magnetovibrio blakemorei TaxID=28181 RepID=A0A1E5Q6K7_9PROT|nr:hypothetical protein [Magnetovibrio blakemorei]OEJ66582.1 hypothetical protein BEN30_12035 [Magnetovibrio blakemorei]